MGPTVLYGKKMRTLMYTHIQLKPSTFRVIFIHPHQKRKQLANKCTIFRFEITSHTNDGFYLYDLGTFSPLIRVRTGRRFSFASPRLHLQLLRLLCRLWLFAFLRWRFPLVFAAPFAIVVAAVCGIRIAAATVVAGAGAGAAAGAIPRYWLEPFRQK